ncbi:MAG: hypothetical protein LBQ11_01380 [Candidatus Nomurabacteria bacterium]|nr:hypothetical protein [Candidatus Nomurabacteria bacterium]
MENKSKLPNNTGESPDLNGGLVAIVVFLVFILVSWHSSWLSGVDWVGLFYDLLFNPSLIPNLILMVLSITTIILIIQRKKAAKTLLTIYSVGSGTQAAFIFTDCVGRGDTGAPFWIALMVIIFAIVSTLYVWRYKPAVAILVLTSQKLGDSAVKHKSAILFRIWRVFSSIIIALVAISLVWFIIDQYC